MMSGREGVECIFPFQVILGLRNLGQSISREAFERG